MVRSVEQRGVQAGERVVVTPPRRFADGQERRPRADERLGERAAAVRPALIDLRSRQRGADRRQARRLDGRGEELGRARIGEPVHRHAPVATGQPRSPFDRVPPVLGLVQERVEVAVRAPAPAHVLGHHDVAVGRVPGGVRVRLVALRDLLVVRRPLEQDGPVTARHRPVDVGPQHGAVTHPASHVALHLNLGKAGHRPLSRHGPHLLCRPLSSFI